MPLIVPSTSSSRSTSVPSKVHEEDPQEDPQEDLQEEAPEAPSSPPKKRPATRSASPVLTWTSINAPVTPKKKRAKSAPVDTLKRVKGDAREVPCLPCLKSAISGHSRGECHDNSAAKRASGQCYSYSSGHKCTPIPKSLLKITVKFLAKLQGKAPKIISS